MPIHLVLAASLLAAAVAWRARYPVLRFLASYCALPVLVLAAGGLR